MKLNRGNHRPGPVVVDSNVKKVQHPIGGIVGRVAGAMAIASRLAISWCVYDTVTRANLSITAKRPDELAAQGTVGASAMAMNVKFPMSCLPAGILMSPPLSMANASYLELRRNARIGQKSQLQQRIGS
jgi:HlyD family secretion protein